MPCEAGNVELRIERVDEGTSNARVFERADSLVSEAQGAGIHSPAHLCGRRSVADLPRPLGGPRTGQRNVVRADVRFIKTKLVARVVGKLAAKGGRNLVDGCFYTVLAWRGKIGCHRRAERRLVLLADGRAGIHEKKVVDGLHFRERIQEVLSVVEARFRGIEG